MTAATTAETLRAGRPAVRFLVVEDNDTLRRGIARALADGFGPDGMRASGDARQRPVQTAVVDEDAAGDAAVARLRDPHVAPYDVVVTDLRLPGAGGIDVLDAARARDARTAVILMTAYGTIETAVEAMRRGAFDFVQKPFELEQLEAHVARALEPGRRAPAGGNARAERAAGAAPDAVIGDSPALRKALALAARVADSRSTVLVTGETGTGKELVAGLIHGRSPRADGPFVKMNCAALPETLLESELFGHERGAFTGADRVRVGRFEQAHGGTLFLDEIGDMAPATQAKLLRVLQDREFHRLGGSRPLRADVRIVAATNRDLEQEMQAGRFRDDLFFRLNVIRIDLAPLRERPEDVEALASHFAAQIARELGRPLRRLAPAAVARLQAHRWPGNVRELRNVIERAVLLADSARIEAADLELPESGAPEPDLSAAVGLSMREAERSLVLAALRRSGFVQKDAAHLLGVSRRKLNYMVQRMGITHPSWRRNRTPASEDADPGAVEDGSAIG